ncbi:MAG: FAD/NAD(P)-binding protein [candidate division KSB1 bacterium]|nr:FAD/NAD(P)-binding protein [candidate division KSB1 bacterium]
MAVLTADPMIPEPFRVVQRKPETEDTFTLVLERAQSDRPFEFQPGQFNMLYVFGVGEVPISISGDPAQPQRLVHTIRAVGTVTRAMQKLRKGAIVGVRGPFGRGWPVLEAQQQDVVIVAGGIGLAPLRPALYHILRHRDAYGRVVLLYGARTPEDILYIKELEKWRGRFDLEVKVTVDRALGDWHGHVGVVTQLIPKTSFDPQNAIAMICGPEIMMRFTIYELQRSGMPNDRIYVSMERNMKCAIGFCGHCQYGPKFICKDGPVFRYTEIENLFGIREI